MSSSSDRANSPLIAGPSLAVRTATESTAALPESAQTGPLLDQWGRTAKDLRISLTDRCNLRCQYCMPAEGLEWLSRQKVLNFEEIVRLACLAIEELGIDEIRFTGGEPLLRKDFPDIIQAIHSRHPHIPLSVTTNGLSLEKQADRLVAAGLKRINVSLDTICPETFTQLTRRDRLADVLKGVDYAAQAGLNPIKINAVLMPGINDDQAPELLDWALAKGYQLRFIEQMPLDADHRWTREDTITAADIRQSLSQEYDLRTAQKPRGDSPAALWDVYPKDAPTGCAPLGQVGIIASVTEPFCQACTRTRLTADGKIRSCLFSQEETDLLELLRTGASDQEIALRWRQAMWGKPAAHGKNSAGFEAEDFVQPTRSMSAIGG